MKNEKWKKCLEILSFYKYMCTKNEDHMIYGSWSLRHNRQKFLSFWVILCPFSPLTTWKIKILKLIRTPGDIIILHICSINDNHMMYVSWDTECDRPFFALLPFNLKNQNFEKLKKYLEISSFYTSISKIMIICYTVPETWCMTDVTVIFHFGLFFTLLIYII